MSIANTILSKVRVFFTRNAHIHFRRASTTTPSELIVLVDRFIDGDLRYDLEWDDFISWKNDNPSIEKFRQEMGEYEPLLFSKSRAGRLNYCNKLIEMRNAMAAIVGLSARPPISHF